MTQRCIAPNCLLPAGIGSLFCDPHSRAPAGQRGGWLSAHKRKLAMVKDSKEPLDAHNISRGLWMGGVPPYDRDLPKVDALFLCAREHQPARLAFHGIVYRCPLIDDYLEPSQITQALMAGHAAAQLIAARKTVLITCSMGRNRSGLVTGFALGYLTRMPSADIVTLIRARRKIEGVLSNPAFVEYLKRYLNR